MIMKQTINDKTIKELEEIFLNLGFQKFRAKQVFRQIHVNKINDFSKMTDLSKDMREKLDQIFYFPKIKILKEFISNLDKTKNIYLNLMMEILLKLFLWNTIIEIRFVFHHK